MGHMLLWDIRIHQDVIQVYNYRDINHIGGDIVHEPLETYWGISESLRHYLPLK